MPKKKKNVYRSIDAEWNPGNIVHPRPEDVEASSVFDEKLCHGNPNLVFFGSRYDESLGEGSRRAEANPEWEMPVLRRRDAPVVPPRPPVVQLPSTPQQTPASFAKKITSWIKEFF
jgi:hypothetical protein